MTLSDPDPDLMENFSNIQKRLKISQINSIFNYLTLRRH